MIEDSYWVRCLNCGYEYYIEIYSSKIVIKCPVCGSKEYEEDNKTFNMYIYK